MINKYKILGILLLSLFAQNAYSQTSTACIQKDNSLLGLVGLDDSADKIFASLSPATSTCGCSYARFYSGNTNTDKILSILLAAKLANKTVRVDFLVLDDCDSAFKVYIH